MLSFYLSLASLPEEKSKIEEIYYKYRKLIYHIAYSKLQKREWAEDALHDVMLAVISNIGKLQQMNEKDTKAFLYIITRNVAVDLLRKEQRRVAADMEEIPIGGGVDPQQDLGVQVLAHCIAQLKPIYRDVLELTVYYGFSAKECASLLKISSATVRKRLERARALLKEQMEGEECYAK
ncbi:MAG: RNA polymerase sigma factor [Clostridia bacterium]|nr:RNA polymerase sigma factor [Clostridia bacterium]